MSHNLYVKAFLMLGQVHISKLPAPFKMSLYSVNAVLADRLRKFYLKRSKYLRT